MSFFNELTRRNVFRVGVAYLIGAWLLAQIADLLIDNIGAPDWVMKTLFVALALGFFLALVFAWAFEMTPDGVKRESEIDRSQSITKTTGHKLDRSIIVILVLALGYFAWDKFSVPTQPVTTTVVEQTEQAAIEKSIAVLPFVNMSADKDNEYFSDGLSEELLNLLAKVNGLKVAARTSSFKFKNSEADIAEIGEKLNVATVLEGSVRKSGNQARITAQLIKVDDGFHLWSETYDRELSNIFQVQDEIARAIVAALKLPLLGQGANAIASTQTANFEAYDLYLLGRFHSRSINAASYETAVDYFSRAVAVDPGYAPAWSGLADAYLLLADYGSLAFGEATALAKKAVDEALLLDADLPEALNSEGLLLNYLGQADLSAAAYERALSIDPDNVRALSSLAAKIVILDPQRSLALAQKAWELDPLSEYTRSQLISSTGSTGDFKGAQALIRNMVVDDPENPGLYEAWANQYRNRGLFHLAIPKMRMTHRLRPGDVYPAWRIAGYYLQLEDLESAVKWHEIARERGPGSLWDNATDLMIKNYRNEWETTVTILTSQIDQGSNSPSDYLFLGRTLMHLNRRADAEQAFRNALVSPGARSEVLTYDTQAKATAQLINVLPAGDEKQQLLDQLRVYAQRSLQVRPFDNNAHLFSAYLATFDNDREATMAALKQSFEQGLRDRHWTESDPVLMHWSNDPMFIQLMLEMKQEAARMHALLEASDQAESASVTGGSG